METKDRQEFASLRDSNLKTARAWALKEAAMALYGYVYERPARKHFRWWHGWAVRGRLQPMIEATRMLKRRLENILTYLRHRITNAASESINSKIQWVKYAARGFRNKKERPDGDPLRRSRYGALMPLKSWKNPYILRLCEVCHPINLALTAIRRFSTIRHRNRHLIRPLCSQY
jgi:hypothetical protein